MKRHFTLNAHCAADNLMENARWLAERTMAGKSDLGEKCRRVHCSPVYKDLGNTKVDFSSSFTSYFSCSGPHTLRRCRLERRRGEAVMLRDLART